MRAIDKTNSAIGLFGIIIYIVCVGVFVNAVRIVFHAGYLVCHCIGATASVWYQLPWVSSGRSFLSYQWGAAGRRIEAIKFEIIARRVNISETQSLIAAERVRAERLKSFMSRPQAKT